MMEPTPELPLITALPGISQSQQTHWEKLERGDPVESQRDQLPPLKESAVSFRLPKHPEREITTTKTVVVPNIVIRNPEPEDKQEVTPFVFSKAFEYFATKSPRGILAREVRGLSFGVHGSPRYSFYNAGCSPRTPGNSPFELALDFEQCSLVFENVKLVIMSRLTLFQDNKSFIFADTSENLPLLGVVYYASTQLLTAVDSLKILLGMDFIGYGMDQTSDVKNGMQRHCPEIAAELQNPNSNVFFCSFRRFTRQESVLGLAVYCDSITLEYELTKRPSEKIDISI